MNRLPFVVALLLAAFTAAADAQPAAYPSKPIRLVIGFARAGLSLLQHQASAAVYRALRSFVGRTILLSLEILVAADLIRTVAVDPSLENVGALALIVLIRTVLSFSLDIEIEGRLPWHRADGGTPPVGSQ